MNSRNLSRHNREQVGYFEGKTNETMIPRESRYLENHIDVLVREAGLTTQHDILEVGCGMGRYTLPLLRRGYRVTGLDISPGLLDQLRGFAGARYPLELHCTDVAGAARTLGRRFDAVIGCFTLHHMHDLRVVFDGVAELLADGGVAAFLEPNPQNPLYYAQILCTPKMRWAMEKGMLRLRRRRVFGLLEGAGLRRCRLHRFGFFPPVIFNTAAGAALERRLERLPFLGPVLPFQLYVAEKHGH